MRHSALLTWLVLCAPAAAVDTPPVHLCEEGLSLELRVLLADDASPWTEVATAAVVVELGGGAYYIRDLPEATGSERYAVTLAFATHPDVARATYHYGARPGQRIVWRHDIAVPARPRAFKQGDSFGSVELEIRSGLPAAIGDPSTTATFQLHDPASDTVLFSGRAASIVNVTEDPASGTWAASLIYDLGPGDLDTAGRLIGEFQVCYAVDACHTLPVAPVLELDVRKAF